MSEIDKIPCHPKNKLLLYHRFILSKISWHFTIADVGKKWVAENIDNVAFKYIRQWLELPISATLSSLVLSKSKYRISLILPSAKFIQCQVVTRNALKSPPNSDINLLWSSSSVGCNIQYDQFRNTKQVLNAIQNDNEDRIHHELKSQGFILSSILLHASSRTRNHWSRSREICLKTFSTSPSSTSITLSLLKRISSNGLCPRHLWTHSAYSLKLFNTLYLVASLTLIMVGIPGVITQFFCTR